MKPTLKANIDLEKLKEMCQDYIDELDEPDVCEDVVGEQEHYIFEEALRALFGEDVFNWVNTKL
jgi:hypothetical protein